MEGYNKRFKATRGTERRPSGWSKDEENARMNISARLPYFPFFLFLFFFFSLSFFEEETNETDISGG